MSDEGVIVRLGYRICDWVGNTIIEPLPHLHQSKWTVNGMQPGAPGSIAIGNFTIPLYPPRDPLYDRFRGKYNLIKYGQRVEAYIIGEDDQYINGRPVFSGIITKINKELDKFELIGFDSLWWAQQTQFYPGQSFTGFASELVSIFCDVDNLLLADDFNGNHYPAGILWNVAIGSAWSSVVDDGLPCLSNSVVGSEQIILSRWTSDDSNTMLASCNSGEDSFLISAWFHIANPSIAVNALTEAGIVFCSNSTATDLVLARAILIGNGTTYDVKAEVWQKVGGTYTNLVSTSVFTGLSGDRRIQLIVIITRMADGQIHCRVLVNGKDSNCDVAITGSVGGANGNRVGVRSSPSTGTPTISFTRFSMKCRIRSMGVPPFQVQPIKPFTPYDAITRFGSVALQSLNANTLIDLWSIGATASQSVWRRDCIRFLVQPLFTFIGEPISIGAQGSVVGTDLSGTVILDEAVNIVSGGALANAESLGTELKLGFSTTTDSDGQLVWPDVSGMLSLGQGPSKLAPPMVLTDTVNITGITDWLTARKIAENTGAHKSLSMVGSKKFTILRTPQLAAMQSTPPPAYIPANNRATSPQIFRELDFIMLNCPSLDIYMQKVSVQSYTFDETLPTFDVTLDQFTFHDKALIGRRLSNNLDINLLTFAQRT